MNLRKLEYQFHVTDSGELKIHNKSELLESVKMWKGKTGTVTFEKKKSIRTIQQNRLWWAYVTIIANELGYRKNEMHEVLKFKFLKSELVNEKTGEVFEYLRSTTALTKSEFGELVDSMIQWASEMNIILPTPNQQLEL